MNIVVTNDDGIHAPGIRALAEAAMSVGKTVVLAPEKNWSCSGHQKTLGRPMRIEKVDFFPGIDAYATDGGPSDCAALAGLGFFDFPIDLVLSGINPTSNLGLDTTYSGTVTSALEATVWGLRGIAFSINAGRKKQSEIDFSAAKKIIVEVINEFMKRELPPYSILNVNIPNLPYEAIKGYKVTREGTRTYKDELIRNVDPFGRPYYWFGGDPPISGMEEGSDSGELAKGFVSVTPLTLDLTAHHLIDPVSNWNWR